MTHQQLDEAMVVRKEPCIVYKLCQGDSKHPICPSARGWEWGGRSTHTSDIASPAKCCHFFAMRVRKTITYQSVLDPVLLRGC